MTNHQLSEVTSEFLDEEGWPKRSPLPLDRVLAWMASEDLEILGATHRLLHVKAHKHRVEPSLPFETFVEFMKRYYRRCLCEAPAHDCDDWVWADSGPELTHYIVGWFADLYRDKTVPRPKSEELRTWLLGLLDECPASGELLVTAIADHLLLDRKIGKFLAPWRQNPRFKPFLS